jgi:hypothetical protein
MGVNAMAKSARTIKAQPDTRPASAATGSGSAETLPDDCPMIPLGYNGEELHVLDCMGQHRVILPHRFPAPLAMSLATPAWLEKNYPRKRKIIRDDGETEWITVDFVLKEFQAAAGTSCRAAGFFDPAERLRGRGAWRGENGAAIGHLGNKLLIDGRLQPLGQRGDYVYALGRALPAPAAFPCGTDTGRRLLRDMDASWRFTRRVDPLFILGIMGVTILGGALHVRPGFSLTGEHGCGKSELMLFMAAVLGGWANYVTDATEAGLRQYMGRDSIGLYLDENEAQGTDASAAAARRIQLYKRASYGGGTTLRGGTGGSGTSFQPRGVIGYAAINLPPDEPADASRNVMIYLKALEETGPRLAADAAWPLEGQRLVRRLFDNYERLMTVVLPATRAVLRGWGWDERHADTLGTTFACAWVATEDHTPTELDLARYQNDFDELAEERRANEIPTWRKVLSALWAWQPDAWKGGQARLLGDHAAEAFGWGKGDAAEEESIPGFIVEEPASRTEAQAVVFARQPSARKAAGLLRRHGIQTVTAREDDPSGRWRAGERLLAIAKSGKPTAEVFRGTPWAASNSGQAGYVTALSRAPTAGGWPYPIRFSWGTARVVVMRLDVGLNGLCGPDSEAVIEAWEITPSDPRPDVGA